MPTDSVKEIMDGDIFIQDKEGNMNKIVEIAQFESIATDEKDDAADALRYAVENTKGYTGAATFTITKEASIRIQKMLGVQRITRKRFMKLLMGCGIQRNDAEIIAKELHNNKISYTPYAVQNIFETLIKEGEI